MKNKQKKIAVLLAGSSPANGKVTEAMRMAVGLTLRNPGVQLFLMHKGIKLLETREPCSDQQASFMEHLNAYLDLGCPVVVEQGVGGRSRHLMEGSGMEAMTRVEMISCITDSDVVILLDEQALESGLGEEPQSLLQGEAAL
ncbi:MAG: hypothetical protein WHX93_05020 [bacterium]